MDALELIVIPDETEPGSAEVYVDGTIDGRPYRFLLDTGAARSCVIADEYTAALPSIEKHDSSGVFAASSEDVITVPSLTVGPITRQDFTLVRAPADSPGTPTLIGMDLLKDYRCHFLFDANRVLLERGGEPEAHPAPQALFLDSRAHPYVDVQFGPATAHAVWDTGAESDRGRHGIHPAASRLLPGDPAPRPGRTPPERPWKHRCSTWWRAVIGDTPFSAQRVAGVDLSRINTTIEHRMDLILGYNHLRQANWLFDFPRKQWGIKKRLEA